MSDPLGGPHDVEFWRALEERSTGGGARARNDEFPADAALAPSELSRRDFVKLLGASAALAGLGACAAPPADQILPYADRPPEVTPGIPRYYATSMVLGGYATGLLVASREGRPVKVEGNPRHPASLGAAGVYEQASVLQLYDPHRGRTLLHRGQPESWATLLATLGLQPQSGVAPTGTGEGLAFLLEPTGSPLLLALLAAVRARYPAARIYFHGSPSDASLAGARLVYGRPLQTQYDFTRAATIVSLDADFLASTPFHLRYAHDFAERRRIAGPDGTMNRLYAAEPVPTPTGAMADHRLRVRASEVEPLAAALLAALGGGAPAGQPGALSPVAQAWVAAAAEDLAASRGTGVVIAGDRQPAAVHALAHRINAAAGNLGSTVTTREPVLTGAGADEAGAGLTALAQALQAGQITTLLIFEGNPVYTAPADLGLAELVKKAAQSVYLGLYPDETAVACSWYVPARHYLEQWSDAAAYDGTLSLVQPLVQPLYPPSRSGADLLALYAGRGDLTPYDLLRETWSARVPAADFESIWSEALRTGVVPAAGAGSAASAVAGEPARPDQSASPVPAPALTRLAEARHPRIESGAGSLPHAGEGNTTGAVLPSPLVAEGEGTAAAAAQPAAGALELVFPLDQTVYDGRFANLSWLQELPEPISKLTWDNAALLSPATAKRLGVGTGEIVELKQGGRTLRAPALVLPGLADETIALHLGYGRSAVAEPVARGVGVNANRLRTTAAPYFAAGAELTRVQGTGGKPLRHALAITQTHWTMQGRPVVLHATLAEYRAHPDFARRQRGRALSLYHPFVYEGEQWAMTIDLSLCSGCGACVVACQAENNIPVVGKDGVMNSREMHWLRIDRYFAGGEDDPLILSQPMMCQHCEKAPCEYVCPVAATTHSPDGLNEMTYNRCVGTRFCSNNCPYKVRRFNWFNYNTPKPATEQLVMNPDVTVRARGVMEKCTYCVQRIRRHQIARSTGRDDPTAQVLETACQQTCPTGAIVFGSLGDPESAVVRLRREPRSYSALHELGTEPRTQYLAHISNPNPRLAQQTEAPA